VLGLGGARQLGVGDVVGPVAQRRRHAVDLQEEVGITVPGPLRSAPW
jgi:hypothetical protein